MMRVRRGRIAISSNTFNVFSLLLSEFVSFVAVLVDPGIFLSESQQNVVEFPIDLGMPCLEPVPKLFNLMVAWFVFHASRKVVLL